MAPFIAADIISGSSSNRCLTNIKRINARQKCGLKPQSSVLRPPLEGKIPDSSDHRAGFCTALILQDISYNVNKKLSFSFPIKIANRLLSFFRNKFKKLILFNIFKKLAG
jgi:hypothetical protein